MQNTKNSLNALLSAAGLKEDAFRRRRTAYSFRRTYASCPKSRVKLEPEMGKLIEQPDGA